MKIVCIGRNYTAHINELQNEKPKHPVLFLKPDTTILQKNQPFFIPHFTDNIHYEVEVLVKIKKLGKHIEPQFAHKYYNQIGLGIDFTARTVQKELKENGLPWEKSKAFDGSTLIGEWYDKSRFDSLEKLSFSLEKNGEEVQPIFQRVINRRPVIHRHTFDSIHKDPHFHSAQDHRHLKQPESPALKTGNRHTYSELISYQVLYAKSSQFSL